MGKPSKGVNAPETMDMGPVRLRRVRSSDAPALLECGSDLEVARYADWPLSTELEPALERIRQRNERWDAGEQFYWVITLPGEDRAIGAISCRIESPSAEVGFFVHRGHWNHGYATLAARAVVDWAMTLPSVSRVWGRCDTENAASVRVLEKAGLSLEKLEKRSVVRPNLSDEPRDAFVYSLER